MKTIQLVIIYLTLILCFGTPSVNATPGFHTPDTCYLDMNGCGNYGSATGWLSGCSVIGMGGSGTWVTHGHTCNEKVWLDCNGDGQADCEYHACSCSVTISGEG